MIDKVKKVLSFVALTVLQVLTIYLMMLLTGFITLELGMYTVENFGNIQQFCN